MSAKSDILALEKILNYASEEAQRLHVSGVVLKCLRLAAAELGHTNAHAPTPFPDNDSLH